MGCHTILVLLCGDTGLLFSKLEVHIRLDQLSLATAMSLGMDFFHRFDLDLDLQKGMGGMMPFCTLNGVMMVSVCTSRVFMPEARNTAP